MANGQAPDSGTAEVQTLIDQGLVAAEAERYEEAAETFGSAVEIDPANPVARYNLALAQQRLGDLEGAVATYLRTIQLEPTMIEAYINLGHLYSELNLGEESLEIFQRAIELDESNDELYVALGMAYRDLNFFEDAIQAFRQAEILNPENVAARENLHETRERVRTQSETILELERQLDADPRESERYAELIGAYIDARRLSDAQALTERMIQLFPDDPNAYATMALVQEMLGNVDGVALAWQQVTRLDPEDVDAWEKLGDWQADQGLIEEAISAYRKAIELDPEGFTARFRLAETLIESAQYDEAISIYQSLVDDITNLPDADEYADAEEIRVDAHVGLAEALNAAGRYTDSLGIAERILNDFPDEPLALYQKATALDGLGRNDEAIETYIASLENNPLNAEIYNDLADTYIKVNDLDNAVEMAMMAIALMPDMDVAYETLAQALRAAGRNEEADAAMAQADALRNVVDFGVDDELN